jgi:hypothetical protein
MIPQLFQSSGQSGILGRENGRENRSFSFMLADFREKTRWPVSMKSSCCTTLPKNVLKKPYRKHQTSWEYPGKLDNASFVKPLFGNPSAITLTDGVCQLPLKYSAVHY